MGYETNSSDLLFNGPAFKHRLPSERSNESGVLSALSPIPEAQGIINMTSGSEGTDCTVSASASCESVTGDSGVFDASSRRTSSSNLSHLETAQVKVGLRYACFSISTKSQVVIFCFEIVDMHLLTNSSM